MTARLPEELLTRIAQVTNKRARLVLDTIAQKGSITTEELQKLGYEHAPRAARDVRELGFTLVTTMIKTASGKRMAEYSLALNVEAGKTGRLQLPKKERDAVIQASGESANSAELLMTFRWTIACPIRSPANRLRAPPTPTWC